MACGGISFYPHARPGAGGNQTSSWGLRLQGFQSPDLFPVTDMGWCLCNRIKSELELKREQSQMAQKPVLRSEVGARALRVRSVSREQVWANQLIGGCGGEGAEHGGKRLVGGGSVSRRYRDGGGRR